MLSLLPPPWKRQNGSTTSPRPVASNLQRQPRVGGEPQPFLLISVMLHIDGSATLSPDPSSTSKTDTRFTHHAPTWTPDRQTSECMHCRSARFSTLKRRVSFTPAGSAPLSAFPLSYFHLFLYASTHQHHCRKCGILVCAGCSANKLLLMSISSKPVRVCDSCFRRYVSGYDAEEIRHNDFLRKK